MGRLWPVREKKRTFFFPNHDTEQGKYRPGRVVNGLRFLPPAIPPGQSYQWIALSAPRQYRRAELSMDRASTRMGPSSSSESKRELSVTRCFLTGLLRRSRSASCRQLAAFSRASPVGVEERAVGNSPLSHGPPLLGRSRFSLRLGFSEKYAFSPDTLKIQQNIHSFKPDFGLFCKKRQA